MFRGHCVTEAAIIPKKDTYDKSASGLFKDVIRKDAIINEACLTHWGRVMHICVNKQTIIGSDNGLLPVRRQAIIWTNARTLLIGPLGTNFSEILFEIYISSFKKMHLEILSGNCHPFCLGLNVLIFAHVPGSVRSPTGWTHSKSRWEVTPRNQKRDLNIPVYYYGLWHCIWRVRWIRIIHLVRIW